MRSLFGVSSSRSRSALFSTLLGGVVSFGGLALSGQALADEPVASGELAAPPSVVTQSTTTTVLTAAPPAALPPPPQVMAPPQMMAPPPLPPPMPGTSGSFGGPVYYNGPVWIIPAPGYGQPQQYAPQPYAPPMYAPPPAPMYAPPPAYRPPVYLPPRRPYYAPRPAYLPPVRPLITPRPVVYQPPRGPVVGFGVRFSAIGVTSQQVFGQDVNMYGGGLFVRFRSQGRFGFEMSIDAMRANINDGLFVRTSYPFMAAPMLYLFQNQQDRHFNIYLLAGFGLMADDVTLYKGQAQERNQQFWEVMGQAGGGIEVRFTRLALFTDIRGIGMLLDDSSPAGAFYQGVAGGPIPSSSAGYKVNAGALLWF